MEMLGREGVIGMAGRECSWYQYNTVVDCQGHPMRNFGEAWLPL